MKLSPVIDGEGGVYDDWDEGIFFANCEREREHPNTHTFQYKPTPTNPARVGHSLFGQTPQIQTVLNPEVKFLMVPPFLNVHNTNINLIFTSLCFFKFYITVPWTVALHKLFESLLLYYSLCGLIGQKFFNYSNDLLDDLRTFVRICANLLNNI